MNIIPVNLKVGDISNNGQITILDEDKLSYVTSQCDS